MAKKIQQATIVADFQLMWHYRVPYKWGTHDWHLEDGKVVGSVDCSGAFVWAYDRHGLDIYNGSNRIARVYCGKLIPVKEAQSKGLIKPGMAAFKCYTPGQSNYSLPSTYRPGGKYYNGDLNDYHHIGLVDTDINYVLNAQGSKTGFVRSRMKENWAYVAELNDVDYHEGGGGGGQLISMKVVAEKGNTVNLRKSASTSSALVTTVPVGSIVQAGPESTGWRYVEYQSYTGYMMSKFLEEVPDDEKVSIVLPRAVATQVMKAIQIALTE